MTKPRQTLTVVLVILLVNFPTWSEQAAGPKPKRIVSLAPSVTETLFALGAGEQLVGICTFCDFPREVERIDRIGSYIEPNVEAIVAKAPDVVIGVPPNSPEAVAALQRAGLKVVIVQVDTIEQIEAAMRTIAREAGRETEGEALLTDVQRQMAAVQARLDGAPQRRVLMVVGQNPLIAVGSGIFLNELITQAHGVNIAADTNQQWPRLSLEVAVAKQPDVIIDGSMGSEEKDEAQLFGVWQNFPELPAVRNNRLYGRRSYTLLRPGPRLAEGFEEIARLIHPERFQ
ncbi:MAG TPA: ABC transporter substrate-binding protein [Candidatus Binatia bacterium]|nr:ABC transporter substrate-binding protein [Candidatus Binatia bacterium]